MTCSRTLPAVFLVALIPVSAVLAQPEPPLHEKETAAAWEAYKNGKFAAAVKHANNCITEFHRVAARRQKELADKKEVVPVGRVTPDQKTAIHNNGPLNDVATAHYIKARALAKLGLKDESAKALAEAAQHPSARAWDSQGGWFWSPADAAELFRTYPEVADKPLHEAYVVLAWAALNRNAPAKAIEHADKCVAGFHAAAQEMEKDLAKRNVQVPTGAVNAQVAVTIFANGVLNDTATALFIKGKAAEARGDKKAAIAAYIEATKLPRARCWDVRGWFWSPAEAAEDRLAIIR